MIVFGERNNLIIKMLFDLYSGIFIFIMKSVIFYYGEVST